MFDYADILERAAIKEYCGGMSRFQAETETAQEFGKKRWELFSENSNRNSASGGNTANKTQRDTTDNLSAMQPHPAKQAGQVLVCVILAGWHSLELLALFSQRGWSL